MPGMWMKARVIGMLEMEDEEGIDHKIICVPEKMKQDIQCGGWQDISDIPEWRLNRLKQDRKSTRLNSSHQIISYAVFCLKKKKRYSLSAMSGDPSQATTIGPRR